MRLRLSPTVKEHIQLWAAFLYAVPVALLALWITVTFLLGL